MLRWHSDAEMAFCVDAVTTEMLAESIKTGIKHHSAHTEMIAHEQKNNAYFSSQRKPAGR